MKLSQVLPCHRVTHPYTDPLVKEGKRRRWLSWLAWGGAVAFYGYVMYLLLEHGARMTDGEQIALGVGALVVGLVWQCRGWGR